MENSGSSRWRRWTRIIIIDVLIFLVVYFSVQLWIGRDALSGDAPALQGVLVSGQPVSLADFRGKPVLVHFWASWCGICRFEHKSIDSIAEDYTVITVMTRSGNEQEARQYLAENDIRSKVILDETGDLADSFNVRGVPASFIINRQGEIDDVEIGYSSEWGLRARLWLADW